MFMYKQGGMAKKDKKEAKEAEEGMVVKVFITDPSNLKLFMHQYLLNNQSSRNETKPEMAKMVKTDVEVKTVRMARRCCIRLSTEPNVW